MAPNDTHEIYLYVGAAFQPRTALPAENPLQRLKELHGMLADHIPPSRSILKPQHICHAGRDFVGIVGDINDISLTVAADNVNGI